MIDYNLPEVFAKLRSLKVFSIKTFALRTFFSFSIICSCSKASYQRDKHVKPIINWMFLSNVSRVLSINKYNKDLSSCRFYGNEIKGFIMEKKIFYWYLLRTGLTSILFLFFLCSNNWLKYKYNYYRWDCCIKTIFNITCWYGTN